MHDSPLKVLLVDDDEDDYIITRDLISQIRERRHHLDWVNTYEGALAALQRREHDICLLDYRLGGQTGLELLRETQRASGRPPVILLTGQGDHDVDVAAMEAGAADYLVKGQLTADTLDRAIRYALEHKRAEERLRRDRDLISRIMETSPVGILRTDRTGKITFANHLAEQVLGLTGDAVTRGDCNVLDWQLADPEATPPSKTAGPLQRVLESGQPQQDLHYAMECQHQRVLLSANAAPLFDAKGKIDGMVITVENITERLGLEAQLRQSQKMESIGQLAAGVAHDINNILTIIQGHAGLLLSATPPGADSETSLKRIAAAADRAAQFVRQLLLFSRKGFLQAHAVNLNVVLANFANMLARLLREDIVLESTYAAELPQINADAGMLEQVVMNLAVNARDAMPNGGRLTITTRLEEIDATLARAHSDARTGRFVCLTISDTGCGMDGKTLNRIFEPFFTTKEIGKGTGLGLATVYGIVKLHEGWIEVTSRVGVGTTFKVFLPAVNAVADPATDSDGAPPAVRGGHETILVVEDEHSVRELVAAILQQYEYRVYEAASGVEALKVWDEHDGRIDLVVTDMIMPQGMTGRDLAGHLRKRKPDVKVLFTSGYSSDIMGEGHGNNDTVFLQKPYRPAQIARLVRAFLDAPAKPDSEFERA